MHPNHTALKRVIAFFAMLGILALSVPFALIAEEPSTEAPAARPLAEVVSETNPARSAFLAISYNGLPDVAAGDTVAMIAKLSGYEGLEYTVYWQYCSETVVDEQSTFVWLSDEEKFGPVYSLTLTRANSGIIRRVKIVITGISGYPDETTGTVTDYSDERPAIIGELAVRTEEPLEIPGEENPVEVSATEIPAEVLVTEIPAEEPVVETPAMEIPSEEPATETPAAEIPAEEPVEETPAIEIPAEEPVEETPVAEIPTEEPVVETPATEVPAEEPAAETLAAEIPAEEPVEETPVTEIPAEEPAAETPVVEIPAEDPIEETPATEIPAEEPVEETPAMEIPTEEPAAETPPEVLAKPEALPIAETIDSTHPDRSVSVTVSWANDVLGIGDAVTLTAVLSHYDGVETEIAWQYDRGNGIWVDAGSGPSFTFILSLDNFVWNWRAAVIPLRYTAE